MRTREFEALFAILVAASPLACVGSDDRGAVADEADTRAPEATSFGRDTASALPYQPVEVIVDSEEPRKVTLHLIVPREPTREQKGATLRAALNSLTQADSTLAAARAVLYSGRRSPTGMEFVATGWAQWVPPEGFEAAEGRSRNRTYRVYVFHSDPGWSAGRDTATEGRRSDA